MDHSYRFSVVIPVLNEELRLPWCIAALQALDFPSDEFEVLFVDNGSTDTSKELICKSGYTLIEEPRRWITFWRQTWLDCAQWERYITTDADAQVPSDWLTRAHQAIMQYPMMDAFTGPVSAYDTHPLYSKFCLYYPSVYLARSIDPCKSDLYWCNFAVKTAAARDVGWFLQGDTKFGEDAILSIRLKEHGKESRFVPAFTNIISARRYKWLRALSLSRNILNYLSFKFFNTIIRDEMHHLK
jgi:glycosyltransferase involved in cell wall biosynthesis